MTDIGWLTQPLEELKVGYIDSTPRPAPEADERSWPFEGGLEDDAWGYWEAGTYTLDSGDVPVVFDGHAQLLVVEDSNGEVVSLAYSDDEQRERYLEENTDEVMGEPIEGSLSAEDLEDLVNGNPSADSSGPMMNYWYPLDGLDEDSAPAAALAIASLPLCIVQVDDTYGLALTGGGMDLSWEIAEAFVRLGYLPPVHFADLPSMAGLYPGTPDRVATQGHRQVLRAMLRSLKITAEQAVRQAERLSEQYPDWVPTS